MVKSATVTTLAAVIFALTLPTMLSLLWHRWSGDPMMRPLGITQEALREQGETDGTALTIYANVIWDPEDPSYGSSAEFAQALRNGFSAKGVNVIVKLASSDAGSFVTYTVGPSSMGPYPASRAAEGINAAVAAYRMNEPFKP